MPDTTVYVEPCGICGDNVPCYATIQSGINAVASGNSVKVAEGSYNEDIILSTSKEVILQGGWDSTFEFRSGTTKAKSMTKRYGTVIPSNFILGPVAVDGQGFGME